MIPDGIALIGATIALFMGEFRWAKSFELIRLARFEDTLYPVYLLVERVTDAGKKRIR